MQDLVKAIEDAALEAIKVMRDPAGYGKESMDGYLEHLKTAAEIASILSTLQNDHLGQDAW